MLRQSDFKDNIKKYGCLVFSLLDISEQMCGKRFNRKQILHMIKHMISRGYIDEDMFVHDHAAVINEGNSYNAEPYIRAKYVGAQYLDHPEKNWGKNEGDYLIYQVRTDKVKGHFIRPYYNPYFPASKILSLRSVRYYDLI